MPNTKNQIEVVLKNVKKLSTAVAQKIFEEAVKTLTDEIIKGTPIDKGDAKANWVLEVFPEKARIYNDLPYMQHLEYGLYSGNGPKTTSAGFSTQAPAGMVRINLKKFPDMVQNTSSRFKL